MEHSFNETIIYVIPMRIIENKFAFLSYFPIFIIHFFLMMAEGYQNPNIICRLYKNLKGIACFKHTRYFQ